MPQPHLYKPVRLTRRGNGALLTIDFLGLGLILAHNLGATLLQIGIDKINRKIHIYKSNESPLEWGQANADYNLTQAGKRSR